MSDAVFIVHQESDKKWVWHLVTTTDEVIASSSKSFETEDECREEIEGIKNYAATAKILNK